MCEICSTSIIKTPTRTTSSFFVEFEHVSLSASGLSIVDFKQANVCWVNVFEIFKSLLTIQFVMFSRYFKKGS